MCWKWHKTAYNAYSISLLLAAMPSAVNLRCDSKQEQVTPVYRAPIYT